MNAKTAEFDKGRSHFADLVNGKKHWILAADEPATKNVLLWLEAAATLAVGAEYLFSVTVNFVNAATLANGEALILAIPKETTPAQYLETTLQLLAERCGLSGEIKIPEIGQDVIVLSHDHEQLLRLIDALRLGEVMLRHKDNSLN